MLEGVCQATQVNIEDKSSDCSKACQKASKKIIKMFDDTEYTDGALNTGEFTDFLSVASIELMAAVEDCQYTSFMGFVDNRLTDIPFLIGLAGQLVTQLALYPVDP